VAIDEAGRIDAGRRGVFVACAVVSLGVWPRPAAGASGQDIVDAARLQIGRTLRYDPAYVKLAYPGGDVPVDRGVCTDVIIRALRRSRGIDLQQAIHEDIARDSSAYAGVPRSAAGPKRDPHIDHRRVPNQAAYFRRRGWAVATRLDRVTQAQPGDIVTWDLGGGLKHVGIVSDRRSSGFWRRPLVIHNIGRGALEEDVLESWVVTGWFRVR
jgi:hypothetical protein